MTVYVKDNVIFHIAEIRQLHTNVSIPEDSDIEFLGYYKLIASVPPEPLPWHRVDQGVPENNTQTWIQMPLSEQEIIDLVTKKVQQRLDDFANTRGYDNIQSLANYAGDEDPVFNEEGTHGKRLRSQTWRTLINIMNDVKAGVRPMPDSYESLALELPELVWL